jgi:hypothetical protein
MVHGPPSFEETLEALKPLHQSSAVHIAFGFLLMGGWALWANRAHGLEEAWLPALAQGVFSGAMTGLLKSSLEWMDGRVPPALAYVLPPVVTASVILTALTVMHIAIGTPEVARTVAFPWSVSTLYAIVYNAGLVRSRRALA